MNNPLAISWLKFFSLAAIIVLAWPDIAFAQPAPGYTVTDLKGTVSETLLGMKEMPIVLSGIAYLAGGATMLYGCSLLKKHADNPQGTPLLAGLSRLIAGAFVGSLPWLISWAVTTFAFEPGTTVDGPFVPIYHPNGNFDYLFKKGP